MDNRGASKNQTGTLRAQLQKALEENREDSSGCEDTTTTTSSEDNHIVRADRDRSVFHKDPQSRHHHRLQPVSDRRRQAVDSLSNRMSGNSESASKKAVKRAK
ncbi:hypothetical protein N7509_000039 [Penicillium cosmopolitanum]|uniref:Uncharacterized protein n=1 Tax=Penicillium cosmopolitanum TaxID=1131564 RepID=A0A9W9WCM8_9EURO|nr:uncharacterized protein N7509_000039 [Penicillium cosmopolitanum]KAJ5414941.1 hypothetical protein N7509_000039 [Penicillium cosmopolitanum]